MMKKILMLFLVTLSLMAGENMSIYEFEVKDIDGKMVKLEKYKGRVMLIVNVASHCGYTGQYAGLETLHERYSDKGLSILGFPCNQFLSQAPGTIEEINRFCAEKYSASFPRFEKIQVNGPDESLLYTYLKRKKCGLFGKRIKWNFTKFLVDQNGVVLKRYRPSANPHRIGKDIEKLLSRGK